MIEADAIQAMKVGCLALKEIFTDEELVVFLNQYKVQTDTDTTYNIRRSIYAALTSALSVAEQSITRGGVSITKYNLSEIRSGFASAGTVNVYRED